MTQIPPSLGHVSLRDFSIPSLQAALTSINRELSALSQDQKLLRREDNQRIAALLTQEETIEGMLATTQEALTLRRISIDHYTARRKEIAMYERELQETQHIMGDLTRKYTRALTLFETHRTEEKHSTQSLEKSITQRTENIRVLKRKRGAQGILARVRNYFFSHIYDSELAYLEGLQQTDRAALRTSRRQLQDGRLRYLQQRGLSDYDARIKELRAVEQTLLKNITQAQEELLPYQTSEAQQLITGYTNRKQELAITRYELDMYDSGSIAKVHSLRRGNSRIKEGLAAKVLIEADLHNLMFPQDTPFIPAPLTSPRQPPVRSYTA